MSQVETKTAADVVAENHGSVWQFWFNTEAARDFVIENVQSEDWQWLGAALCVDHRYAGGLVEFLLANDFDVRVTR
jgi:hypothetical protein